MTEFFRARPIWRIFAALVALSLTPAFAEDPGEPPAFAPVPGETADLGAYVWTSRPVVVFADSTADPAFAEQMTAIAERWPDLAARDVVVEEREAVAVSAAPTDSYDSVYGSDDLDIPDFLK